MKNEVVPLKQLSVKKLAQGGVMAALVFVLTYFPKVPIPGTSGYIHLGDGAIFLSAMLLGPLSVAAAAIGSALSDLVGGYVIYVLPTLIIKGLMALIVWKMFRAGKPLMQLTSFVLAEIVMVGGYFVVEWALYGLAAAAGSIAFNCIQGAAGVVLGMLFTLMIPRLEKVLH